MSALALADNASSGPLWGSVERLVGRASRLSDLTDHRLELFEARRRRAAGEPVPPDLLNRERAVAVRMLAAPALLERVRAAYDGRLLVIKGAEVASRYPDPALRAFGDIDLIADDAHAAQAALLAAGFREIGDPELYVDIHHLRPLQWPGLPLAVELHTRPKWVEPLQPPSAASLLDAAGPSSLPVEGFLAPPPAQHAVLLAVHSWAHEPLRRLSELVDVAALAAEAEPGEPEEVAREWGVPRLWATTHAVAESLLADGRRPFALRIWARNLEQARERSVLENHLQRWLGELWALPLPLALRRLPRTFWAEISPSRREGWARKLARGTLALRNATKRRSEHEREAGVE